MHEKLFYLHNLYTDNSERDPVILCFRDCSRVHGSVLSVSSFSVSQALGSILECVQYKSRVQAFTVRNGIYSDEDISSKPQAPCDLGIPHAEKEKRDIEMEKKIARLADSALDLLTLTLRFLCFCML